MKGRRFYPETDKYFNSWVLSKLGYTIAEQKNPANTPRFLDAFLLIETTLMEMTIKEKKEFERKMKDRRSR
jgi:hypothetical protein